MGLCRRRVHLRDEIINAAKVRYYYHVETDKFGSGYKPKQEQLAGHCSGRVTVCKTGGSVLRAGHTQYAVNATCEPFGRDFLFDNSQFADRLGS